MRTEQIGRVAGRAAGKLAGQWLPVAKKAKEAAEKAAKNQSDQLSRQIVPAARQSGRFVKHVMPQVVKPLHSLWHQVLAFIFLAVAGLAAWKLWRTQTPVEPPMMVLVVLFIVVTAGYGLSSLLKSNRISRS